MSTRRTILAFSGLLVVLLLPGSVIAQCTDPADTKALKKHLKLAFATLGAQSRAELGRHLARLAPDDGLPRGVTRVGDVWVTKSGTRMGNRRPRGESL